MTDGGMLSQDEIDALLGNSDNVEQQSVDAPVFDSLAEDEDATPPLSDYLNEMEADVLGEIGNISFGSAATALSTILNQKVDITTPQVSMVRKKDLDKEFPVPHVAILVNYTEGFQGSNVLIIQMRDASVIAKLMMGGNGKDASDDIGEMELSAVQEAMNQMMGSSATSMSTVFSRKVDISPPSIDLMDVKASVGTENLPDDELLFKISFRLKIGDLVDSTIMQMVPIDFAKTLVTLLLQSQDQSIHETVTTVAEEEPMPAYETVPPSRSEINETSAGNIRASQSAEKAPVNHRPVQSVEFTTFDDDANSHLPTQNIDLLMDIPLHVTVELGQTRKTIKEVLEMGPGSIIELDKLAGEPVDILINQKRIAKGEVVVIEENFGVRITEIINQRDRLRKL